MEIRKGALKVSVGFLLLSALFAIWVVLVGQFGEFELRVLLTTLSISIASMCAMACGAHIERTGFIIAGSIGIAFAVLSFLLTQMLVWEVVDTKGFWKTCWSCVVISFALAHALLLNLPALATKHLWLRYLADFSVGLLAILVIYLVWQEGSLGEGYFRFLIVVGIVIALVSVLVPIFSKLDEKLSESDLEVLLKKVKDDYYVDQNGNHYKLHKVDIEQVN